MGVANVGLYAFNRGIVSKLALARTDIPRVALSAETMTNWLPRVLGPMSLRPGLGYRGSTRSHNVARYLPFVFSTTDTALLELTDSYLRVWVNDSAVEREAVSTAVTNGTFDTNIASWTTAGAGSVAWATGGYLSLQGSGQGEVTATQQVVVGAADVGVEHALTIVVERGPVTLRVGASSGSDEYIAETDLDKGYHSLAFTPSGAFYIQFATSHKWPALVNACTIESAGVMQVPSPYTEAALPLIRYDQSGDVVFIACRGYQQRKIERRDTHSWSVVVYETEDGPFDFENDDEAITVTPSAVSGSITLTANSSIFSATDVGSLFQVISKGQRVDQSVTKENVWSDYIKVTGEGNHRKFTISRSGTWSATVTLQRTADPDGGWEDVTTYTNNATISYNDGLDNETLYYRIGVAVGAFTSGTVVLYLNYPFGSITGTAIITGYTSGTQVTAEVRKTLGGTSATSRWAYGRWSDTNGWPSAVCLHEGRLCWAGRDNLWCSVSDDYYSFDAETVGDSGPIDRSIGSGPVDTINWVMSLQRLVMGGQGAEYSIRSSSFDEPITPTAFAMRAFSTQGSSGVDAVKIDRDGVYVQKCGSRIYQMGYNSDSFEYDSGDLTLLCPEIGLPSVVRLAVQRKPDTRIHCVRSDGIVALIVFDPAEQVKAWCLVETDGDIEDVAVLPGSEEDLVYYVVKRVINGSTVRYLEKWAFASQCVGGTLNYQADAFVGLTQSSSATITGLSHLEGEAVVVWANGKDLGNYTVSGGQITVSEAVTSCIVGLEYTAQWKSSKLAFAAALGTGLLQPKTVKRLGLILADTHYQGVTYGPDFSHLDPLPAYENGAAVSADTVHSTYDEESFPLSGTWDTDSRLCLQAQAPRPATVVAAVIEVDTHDRY